MRLNRRNHILKQLATALMAGVLALSLSAAHAQEPGQLARFSGGSSFGRAFDNQVRKTMVKEVPLVREEGARVVMANHRELKRLGFRTSPGSRHDHNLEKGVVNNFAFRPATEAEIKAGKHTHMGLATRYADARGGEKGVKGDGRAALTGEVVIKDRKGNITGVYDIQVKGVGTGLHPNWKGFGHRHGKESLRQATEDALFSDYLSRNGIKTNKWLAVIDSGSDIVHPNGGRERAGLLIRGGNFTRLAHWNLVRNDKKALRQLVDFANTQVSMEMGRSRKMSIPGLYKTLTQRKANEMADMFFLRTVHGSTTYDNIGLMENMDHGTGSTVDRTHKNYSFFSKWIGYGGEPKFVMDRYVKTELYNLMMKSATPAEQKELKKLRPDKIADGMLERRFTQNTLLHAGMSKAEAKKAMNKDRGAAKTFMTAFTTMGNIVEQGKKHKMGKSTQVENPARYDMFAALNKLPETKLGTMTMAQRVDAVARAMRPGAKLDTTDTNRAKMLVEAYDKVIKPVVGKLGAAEARGRIKLMKERAGHRNRHAVSLVRQDLRDYSISVTDRVKGGEPLNQVRADLNAFMRKNNVLGPGSAVHTADMVLGGRAPKTRDGYLVLSKHKEDGVTIQQLSNGTKDMVRVTVKGDPLGLRTGKNYKLHLNLGGDSWKDYSPSSVNGAEATYDIPLGEAPIKKIRAAFFDATGRNKKWLNNGGRNYGKGIQSVLDSSDVQVALSVEARRRGGSRGALKSNSLRAVSKALFNNERSRQASRGKKKTATTKKTTKPRTPRHQRALQRAIQKSGTAALHTHKLKAPRVRKAKAKKTTKFHKKQVVQGRPHLKVVKNKSGWNAKGQRGGGYKGRQNYKR